MRSRIVALAWLLAACSGDAQLRKERLASPDCQRPGADPEKCGGLEEAKASRGASSPGAGASTLKVISNGLGGFVDGARPASASGGGCVNSYSCQYGYRCVVPQGSTTGYCAEVR